MTILKEQVAAVLNRRNDYKEAMDYYEGNVPETFASARLRRAFKTTGDRSRLNFCRPVVDAVADRLEIATISGDTKAATAKIAQVWADNDLGLDSMWVNKSTLVYGESFALVWPDAQGVTRVSFHAPTNMAMVYDPEDPKQKLYAVKIWRAGEADTRLNVYSATSITKYRTNSDEVNEGTNWTFVESLENPFGQVPVFHFRTERPNGRPEHKDAYDAQNAINKLFVTNMFTIDYQGAPQRYALSHVGSDGGDIVDYDEEQTERENMGSLKNGPGELWYLKGIHTVGEFKPANSDVFWGPIDSLRETIAALTKTPMHYLLRNNNQPTGQSLRVSESGLLKKVHDRQVSFGYTWREIFRFILSIEGVSSDVQVLWSTHESLDELERWDVALKKLNSGLSHKQALREGGYTEDQITQIMKERDEEAKAGQYYSRVPNARISTDPQNNEAMPAQEASAA